MNSGLNDQTWYSAIGNISSASKRLLKDFKSSSYDFALRFTTTGNL